MSSPEPQSRVPHRSLLRAGLFLVTLLTPAITAHATLPPWLQHIVGASSAESDLYRLMHLPGADVLYPRPPKEAQTQLATASTPELYQLRARTDEAALDFTAAERDWKLATEHAADPVAANLELANFYHRRLATAQELATLRQVGASPTPATERYAAPESQRAWLAFQRSLDLASRQGLPPAETAAIYDAFLARYPHQPAVYARAFQSLLQAGNYPAAEALLPRYRAAFPAEPAFPIRAQALLAYSRGDSAAALAVYDRAYQPLWPADLVQSFYALLAETHQQRRFIAQARASLAAHPEGPEALNAVTRIFYYDQQAGRLPQAQATLDTFRTAREARTGAWSPEDLHTLATLERNTTNYAEAARYDYALASLPGNLPSGEPAAQAGLAGLVNILLTAESDAQPLALGAGNLTLYRDIATLDHGPGYWNGILSLWLNGTSPASEYQAETGKAQTYFHRAKAAELLAELDRRYPAAPQRPALHAQLLHVLAQYGTPEDTIAAGKQYLADYPKSPARLEVANLLADAYQRQADTTAEFALYDQLLNELAAAAGNMPLSAAGTPAANPESTPAASESTPAKSPAYELDTRTTLRETSPAAADYARLLDRYLGRLTDSQQLPQALLLLRRQLDRNPDDPALYERLATFLQQNNLTAPQEAVYKQAIARFNSSAWYDKLARFYLRQKNTQAFAALTRQVTGIFAGTDLDRYFQQVGTATPGAGGPALAVQLNLYAQKRFPHDLVFTRNLLAAYQQKPTTSPAAYEALLRQSWWTADDLRQQFFEYLARTNKLSAELSSLAMPTPEANPAATRELGELHLWQSHFEQATPLLSRLSDLYPADPTLGDTAVSLFRSAAYLDPTPASTARAAAIEQRLLLAFPDSPDRLATLGDLYAEATALGGEDLRTAAPIWHRIPALHPGTPAGSLTTATIFWDYFQFDDALAELSQARTRFQAPTLYGYEAGAIEENRHDLSAAIREYTAVVVQPPARAYFLASVDAAVDALEKPPSDAADSNLQSTAQSLFNATEARDRLLKLAVRPATAKLVDQATAAAAADSTSVAALTLRADVLLAQKRPAELPPLLTAALARATTVEQAAAIGALAQADATQPPADANLDLVTVHLATGEVDRGYAQRSAYALQSVYEAALARQSALSADPVEKLQFNYQLADALEAHRNLPAAQKIIAEAYAANPRVLGVVRRTVDFYTRTHQSRHAIATLLDAAKAATPALARGFTLEAAAKANDTGDPLQGRALALAVLHDSPYDPQVLALVAASYARANDNAGLKAFYLQQIDLAKTNNLNRDERKANIALLRRGLIPALTRLSDFDGAEAQYIALLSAYPEDTATAQEAANYALAHNRQSQLLAFLRTTVQQSPQDSRFAVLLAQAETTFEDLPAALAAYTHAIAIRKDRPDLYEAHAALALRLDQPELAAVDYQRLYLLTYHDPRWLVSLAELRVRQQRPAEAVAALNTAWIEGRPLTAEAEFRVAAQLLEWNLLPQARTFADRGRTLAGPALLTTADNAGAAIYARILTRQGQAAQALNTLVALRATASTAPLTAAQLLTELAKQGLTEDDAAEFRKTFAEQRRQNIKTNFDAAVKALGTTAAEYQTPEEKLAFASTLDTLHATNAPAALATAIAAGLPDREAAWRKADLLTRPPATQSENLAAYQLLQTRRLAFPELAQTLEAYAARLAPGPSRRSVLQQAAEAWHNAATPAGLAAELRLARTLAPGADATQREHYLDLLLRHDRAALATFAAGKEPTLAHAAVNYAVAHATLAQASTVIAARARTVPASPALWTNAALAQAGLYLEGRKPPPQTLAAFAEILSPQATIADRLNHPAGPATVLTGELWFAFASRYGIALTGAAPAEAEDYLPAFLEQAPTFSVNYVDLARTYAEAGNTPAALTEYTHALELAPNQPELHDEIAVLQSRAGNSVAALAEWRAALDLLRRNVLRNNFSESFYTTFTAVLDHLAERRLAQDLTPEIEAVLRPELAKNGNYRSNELLEALYKATPDPSAGQLLALASAAANPGQVLADLKNAPWLPPQAQLAILARRLQLAQAEPAARTPFEQTQLTDLRLQLLDAWLAASQPAPAQALLATIPPADRQAEPRYTRIDILLAARTGRLPALIAAYTADPGQAPSPETLRAAASTLSADNAPAARQLREYLFDRQQQANALTQPDFLALAQSRLDTGDLPGALNLLHRLALRAPDDDSNPNANLDAVAALLESTHHPAEALVYLRLLTANAPWNPGFRLRLGQAQRATESPAAQATLTALAKDSAAPYDLRAEAATALASAANPAPGLGSGELNLLATPHPTAAAARQPYYLRARLLAARNKTQPASENDQRILLREALAMAPEGLQADRTRLQLLQLTVAQDDPATALALLATLQSTPATHDESSPETEADETPAVPEPPPLSPGDVAPATFPPIAATLDIPTRLHLAQALSEAYVRLDDLDAALAWALAADRLNQTQPHPETRLAAVLTTLRQQRTLAARNAARAPVLTPNLRAPANVRPRLTLAQLRAQENPQP